jgi:hypothetical protein
MAYHYYQHYNTTNAPVSSCAKLLLSQGGIRPAQHVQQLDKHRTGQYSHSHLRLPSSQAVFSWHAGPLSVRLRDTGSWSTVNALLHEKGRHAFDSCSCQEYQE